MARMRSLEGLLVLRERLGGLPNRCSRHRMPIEKNVFDRW
jgi:hypothetical protein